jgi:Xaa-Pro aminopeptidase
MGWTRVAPRWPVETLRWAQKEIVEATVSICDRLRDNIKPGVRVMEIALLGDELVAASGYGENRVHESWPYYGHGLGCMWEPPLIDKRCCDELETFEAGMVLGVECFLGTDGLGIVGYEDNFIVTDTGTEIITPSPALWW